MSRILVSTAGLVAALSLSAPVLAHTKARAAREIIRLQGSLKTTGSDENECARAVSLRVLNTSVQICVNEMRQIAVATTEIAKVEVPPAGFEIQGERKDLARLTKLLVSDTVSILAEWRPGRRDLFLIALDVFPCKPKGNP